MTFNYFVLCGKAGDEPLHYFSQGIITFFRESIQTLKFSHSNKIELKFNQPITVQAILSFSSQGAYVISGPKKMGLIRGETFNISSHKFMDQLKLILANFHETAEKDLRVCCCGAFRSIIPYSAQNSHASCSVLRCQMGKCKPSLSRKNYMCYIHIIWEGLLLES